MPHPLIAALRHIRPAARTPPGRPPDPPWSPPTLKTVLDGTRIALELLKESTDAFPPLKSGVGAVLGLWSLAERVDSTSNQVTTLASRASSTLLAMNDALTAHADIAPLLLGSPLVLKPIDQFFAAVNDIHSSVEAMPMEGKRLRNLRQNEETLAKLAAGLDDAHEAFTVGMHIAQAIYTVKVHDTTTQIASNMSDVSASLGIVTVELTKLRTQVQYLQLTVVFLD
ncbi:hypothetical protein C8F01DRAFT_1160803 [Mycena amicta]|nr:hypothetical protein C8F01DRAFT_1160803 [Mycena amicta]